MDLVGYSDPMVAAPGGTVRFMVSCRRARFRFDLVRLYHGDENPAGPGFREVVVDCDAAGEYPGKEQRIEAGSFVEVPDAPALRVDSLAVEAWIWPTLPLDGVQGLVAKWDDERQAGVGLFVGEAGDVELWVGDGASVARVGTGRPLHARRWYRVAASVDAATGRVEVRQEAVSPSPLDASTATVTATVAVTPAVTTAPLLVGCRYNGKIDSPRIYGGDGAAVAAWDFSRHVDTTTVVDTGPHGLHGRTVNMPARAMTGWNWDGRETAFSRAPEQYGAIHFHDDDLADAGWEPSVEVTLPDDLPSGVYAARLRADDVEDYVPFFVRPAPGTATADIAFLAPTVSYLAYANFRGSADPVVDAYVLDNNLLSLYDLHRDGSGTCYSSCLRPNLTLRPKARLGLPHIGSYELPGFPHQFAADLHLVDWFDRMGHAVDVLTDEVLDGEGVELLRPYRVVVTGSHPEYWTEPMLDAVDAYLRDGGRMLYLGGNGFYWVTSLNAARTVAEVRRITGTRAWEAEPGEGHHSTTGEPGGLWRHRGRPPQRLVGVGFTGQGFDRGAPYHRTEDSDDPRVAFVFAGLPEDRKVTGDHHSLVLGHGAAGFELDRADTTLGTPYEAFVLASSSAADYSASYQRVVEEVLMSDSKQGAPDDPLVRADMVLVHYPNGGAVLSVGSISWCGGLSHNGYDNDVSRITDNVLRAFASGRDLLGEVTP